MPYKTNADLPTAVKDALPSEAQTVYREVFNENEDKGESSAAAIAWTAVKNGWEKGEDGKWVRKDGVNKGQTEAFELDDVVTPLVEHMPGQKGKPAKVVLVRDGPYYALDFGDSEPHKWYAHDELKPASGQKVEKHTGGSFNICKADDDRNLVFGWANVSIRKDGEQIVDHHQDMIDPEDLEDAAYVFNLEFRETGVMHKGEAVGRLVESLVVTPEKLQKMGLPSDSLPIGWWVGFYVEDDAVFAKVKSGDYAMFSIQGRAIREEVTVG